MKPKAEQKTKLGRISPLFETEGEKQRPEFLTSLAQCLSKDQNVWNPLEAAKLTKRRKISLLQRQQTKTSNLGSL